MENCIPGSGGRLMVFTGGPCTTGPGTVVGLPLEETIRTHRVHPPLCTTKPHPTPFHSTPIPHHPPPHPPTTPPPHHPPHPTPPHPTPTPHHTNKPHGKPQLRSPYTLLQTLLGISISALQAARMNTCWTHAFACASQQLA